MVAKAPFDGIVEVSLHTNEDYNGIYNLEDDLWDGFPHLFLSDVDAGIYKHLYYFDNPSGTSCW